MSNKENLEQFINNYGPIEDKLAFANAVIDFANAGYTTKIKYNPETGYYKYTLDKKVILTDGQNVYDIPNNMKFKVDMYSYLDRAGEGVDLEGYFEDNGKSIVFEPDTYLMGFDIKYWMDMIANQTNDGSFDFDEDFFVHLNEDDYENFAELYFDFEE
jgi:hypothetical protein